jgi:hypothetical protein
MVVPQMTAFGAEHSFLLTSYETQIFTDSLKGELPFRIFGNSSYPTGMFFMLKNKDDRVTLQTIGMNSSGTGWNYAEFRFAQRGRLLFVNASLFENWNVLPDSQIFLKLLFDEMKSQQKSLNKEK